MTRNKLRSDAKIASPSYCEYPNNILQKIEAQIQAISTKIELTSPFEINIDESKVGVETSVQLHS